MVGSFTFPDRNVLELGDVPGPVYAVVFTAEELWGNGSLTVPASSGQSHRATAEGTADVSRDSVCVDLWEDYLDRAGKE